MTEHLLKLLSAYAVGTAATAFLVSMLWLAPVPDYTKQLVSWIIPLPVILIVLVLLYYGPSSLSEGQGLPASSSGIRRLFLAGLFSTLACYAVVPVSKYIINRLTNGDDEEE